MVSSSSFRYAPLTHEGEARQLAELQAQGFLVEGGAGALLPDLARLGYSHGRLLWQGPHLAGGLMLLPMAQWFGGQSVPMVGVAGVVVAPEYRGSGAATHLMTCLLQELRDQQMSLSTLYPAVQGLYRRVGYGPGGSHYRWRVATASLPRHPLHYPVIPLDPAVARTPLDQVRQRLAPLVPGSVQRPDGLWHRLLQSDPPPWVYLVGPADDPQGYVVLQRHSHGKDTILALADWAVVCQQAAQDLWRFLAAHSSMVDAITWSGGAMDPLALALPEQAGQVVSAKQWFTRIVDVPLALSHRGYPTAVTGEIHLRIHDPVLPQNNGCFVLTLNQGQGRVSPGGRGDLSLAVDEMTPLYTGLWSAPYLAQWLGTGQASPSLATAAALAAQGVPWMVDFF